MVKYKALVSGCWRSKFEQAYVLCPVLWRSHFVCDVDSLTFLNFPWDWPTRAFPALELEYTFSASSNVYF